MSPPAPSGVELPQRKALRMRLSRAPAAPSQRWAARRSLSEAEPAAVIRVSVRHRTDAAADRMVAKSRLACSRGVNSHA